MQGRGRLPVLLRPALAVGGATPLNYNHLPLPAALTADTAVNGEESYLVNSSITQTFASNSCMVK